MIRLLLDMGLPRRSADSLNAQGWDCVHIGALGRCRATDAEILALAAEQNRVVITLDADFSRLLALSNGNRPSVVFLRLDHLDHNRATELLSRILPPIEMTLSAGCLVVVNPQGIRVRSLPLLAQRSSGNE
jgi:predicted nuclease of predicted toxin-antitoxin system